MNAKLTSRLAATLVVATLPFVSVTAAHAGDDDVIRRGSCSEGAAWKIKAKPDDGRLEVEAEVDSNVKGQTWKWVLRHNGRVADRGQARTKGPSGSFSVERHTGNRSGADQFRFRAVNRASGEVCVARIKL